MPKPVGFLQSAYMTQQIMATIIVSIKIIGEVSYCYTSITFIYGFCKILLHLTDFIEYVEFEWK